MDSLKRDLYRPFIERLYLLSLRLNDQQYVNQVPVDLMRELTTHWLSESGQGIVTNPPKSMGFDASCDNPVFKELRQIYCCKGAEFCRPTLEKAWKEIERLEALLSTSGQQNSPARAKEL